MSPLRNRDNGKWSGLWGLVSMSKTWPTHDGCDVISKGPLAALQRPESFHLLDEIYSLFPKKSILMMMMMILKSDRKGTDQPPFK
jgi:hypothetical protein